MLRQRRDSLRNLVLALAVALVSGRVVDAGCSKGGGKCGITCSGVNQGLADLIKEQYDKMQGGCPILDSLMVESSSFPDQTLSSGWLPKEVPLNGTLTFKTCDFAAIDDDAFHGDQFLGVVTLQLHELVKLRVLRRDHFRSLKDLDTLDMRQLDEIEHVEDGLLSENAKLSTLQFSNGAHSSVARFLANITGNDNYLPNLQTVDLGHNNLGALEPRFFTSFARSRLAQLYLNAANVTEIASGTFPVTVNLAKLELSENQMVTLAEDFYDGSFHDNAVIFLEQNPWLCSCDIKWMINMTYIKDHPSCVFAGTNHNVSIKNVTEEEICGDGGHTTPTSTTTTSVVVTTDTSSVTTVIPTTTITTDETTESTTDEATESTTDMTTELTTEVTTETLIPPNNGNIVEECEDGGASSSFSEEEDPSCGYDGSDPGTVIQMSECADGDKVNVRVSDSVGVVDLFVWSNTTQSYNGTCLRYDSNSSAVRSFYVTRLTPSESFIVCAVSAAYGVNVRHCGAHTMQPVAALRPWLKNGNKDSYRIGTAIGVVAVFLASGLVTVMVIRRRPTLLGSNVHKVSWTDDRNQTRHTIMVTPRGYRPAAAADDVPPEPPPRPPLATGRPSQVSDKSSTVSYISVPMTTTLRRSQLSPRPSRVTTPRSSDASSTSYVSIMESVWSDTVRSVRRFTASIVSSDSEDTVYERRDSDIPYVPLDPEDFLCKTVVLGPPTEGDKNKHHNPLSRIHVLTRGKDKLSVEAAPRSILGMPHRPSLTVEPNHVLPQPRSLKRTSIRRSHSSPWKTLSRAHKAQDLVQKQLHMFDYVVFEDPSETSDDSCVLDVSPVAEDVHRGLVINATTSPPTGGDRREGLIYQPDAGACLDNIVPTSVVASELRRNLEDSLVLERLEKGSSVTAKPKSLKSLSIRRSHSSPWETLRRAHKSQDLVQKQLHMFDYVVFEDASETSDDSCVLDVSPVTEDVRRGLVINAASSPTGGGRREGLIYQPDVDACLDNTVETSASAVSELRRNLEDSLALESLEKGSSVRRSQNPDVEERALFRPSTMWNHAPHTWSSTVPTIRLQKPSQEEEEVEDAVVANDITYFDCDC